MTMVRFFAMGLVLVLMTGVVCAQTRPAEPTREEYARQARANAEMEIKYLDPIVSLTEAQKQAIVEMYVEVMTSAGEFQVKNKAKFEALQKAMEKAQKDQDDLAMERAMESYQELAAPMGELYRKYGEKRDKLLTAKQKEKFADYQMTGWIKQYVKPVELTEQQLRTVKSLVKASEPPGYQAIPEALEQVLTFKQKTELKKARAVQNVMGQIFPVQLTMEQKEKANELCEKIVRDTSLSQEEINGQLTEKVMGIFTQKQKEDYRKAREPVPHGE